MSSTKRFVALARVSSREQEREGFSLDVQEEALKRYAASAGGAIVKLFRVAETASKQEERKTFKELLAYAKSHAAELDGLVVYKLDRASRNLPDYVQLEQLETEHGVRLVSVSQPTESTPAGRMMRRTLANMAAFYTEQQAVDVKEGMARRVKEGWFVGKAPYGYRNVRKDGRSVVEFDETAVVENVRRIFHHYAYGSTTLDDLKRRLFAEGRIYRPSMPKFDRGTLHDILRDRAYIGEVRYRGQWYPGKHDPLVDRATFDRVQALLGGRVYHAHEMTYAGELMACGHCGRPVTGERKTRVKKTGEQHYVYYRCAGYNTPGHPRIRITETALDEQLLALFDRMKVERPEIREWFQAVLAAHAKNAQDDSRSEREELFRQHGLLAAQQDRLVNLAIAGAVDEATFAAKGTELRDRLSAIKLQLDVVDRSHDETADLACKAFELSQTLKERWLAADYGAKRQILGILCLNSCLDGTAFKPELRKPFDALADGLLTNVTPSAAGSEQVEKLAETKNGRGETI